MTTFVDLQTAHAANARYAATQLRLKTMTTKKEKQDRQNQGSGEPVLSALTGTSPNSTKKEDSKKSAAYLFF